MDNVQRVHDTRKLLGSALQDYMDAVSNLEDEVYWLRLINCRHKDMNLYVHDFKTNYGNDTDVIAIPRIDRNARVYTNAHTSVDGVAKDYCVSFRRQVQRQFDNREVCLYGKKLSYDEALLIAKDYVVEGILPERVRF